jgi:L-ascorbate metabolism protein UlaG (beta-lactamase superfamily)
MHYGSFRLSFEPPEEPLRRLKAEVRKYDMEGKVVVLEEGVPTVFRDDSLLNHSEPH